MLPCTRMWASRSGSVFSLNSTGQSLSNSRSRPPYSRNQPREWVSLNNGELYNFKRKKIQKTWDRKAIYSIRCTDLSECAQETAMQIAEPLLVCVQGQHFR